MSLFYKWKCLTAKPTTLMSDLFPQMRRRQPFAPFCNFSTTASRGDLLTNEQAGVLLSSCLSPEIQKVYFHLQTFCATKAQPGWAAWNKLMSLQISSVSWSFIVRLVGCFTGTCFSHRWDTVNDTTAPPQRPMQQESLHFRLKAETNKQKN